MDIQLRSAGPDAIIIYTAQQASPAASAQLRSAAAAVEQALGDALVDLIPSYTSLLVIYHPLQLSYVAALRLLRQALAPLPATLETSPGKDITLPVYYAAEAGQDLEAVAAAAQLSSDDVVALHTARAYSVYAIGFAPGFAYLGDVDERIAQPRLATPRTRVPRGAVAIAEQQTAVYPAASPGGWNLIGRCPVAMFDLQRQPPTPLAVGDSVRFRAIDRDEYLALGGSLE